MSHYNMNKEKPYLRIATEEAFAPKEMLDLYLKEIERNPADEPGFMSLWGFFLVSKDPYPLNLRERIQDLGERRINDMDVPIYIHPRTPSPAMLEPMRECGLDAAIFGFGVETALHLLRITTSGMPWEPAIKFTQDVLGVDRVLYAMDYPYQFIAEEVTMTDNLCLCV